MQVVQKESWRINEKRQTAHRRWLGGDEKPTLRAGYHVRVRIRLA
jgi:hypothetical protein